MPRRPLAIALATLASTTALTVATSTPALATGNPPVTSLVGSMYGGDGLTADKATGRPSAVAVDSAGNVLVSDGPRIRRVDATTHVVSTVVGAPVPGHAVDGASPTSFGLSGSTAPVEETNNVAVDGAGHIYFHDGAPVFRTGDDGLVHQTQVWASMLAGGSGGTGFASDGRYVYRIDPDGQWAVIGGVAPSTYNPCDNCAATTATLSVTGLAAAPDGSVYLASAGAVRRIATDGTLTTVVSGTQYGNLPPAPADATNASAASVRAHSVAVSPSGEVFFDTELANGTAFYGLTSDGVLHRIGARDDHCGLAATASTLYLACAGLWSFPADGSGSQGASTPILTPHDQAPDGTPASQAYFSSISDIGRASDGTLLIASGTRIRKLLGDGTLGTLADLSPSYASLIDMAPAPDGSTYALVGVGQTSPGLQRVVRIPAGGGTPVVVAGGGSDDPVTHEEAATLVELGGYQHSASALAVAADGVLYLSSSSLGHILKITSDGVIHPFANVGSDALSWDATSAHLYARPDAGVVRLESDGSPTLVSTAGGPVFGVGSDGSVYFGRGSSFSTSYSNGWIDRRFPDGTFGTVAGSHSTATSPALAAFADGVPAAGANLSAGRLLVEAGDGLTFVNALWLPYGRQYAFVRHVDSGYQPVLPVAASGLTASSPGPGVLQLTVPAAPSGQSDCVQTTTDGTTPVWDSSPTIVKIWCTTDQLPTGAVTNPDGSTTFTVRSLSTQGGPLALAGHYVLRDYPYASGSVGTPTTTTVDVTPDTTPPAAPTALSTTVYSEYGQVGVSLNVPSDPDFDHLVVRQATGSTAPATPADGEAVSINPPSGPGANRTGFFYGDVYAPHAISAWAVDIAGNVSARVTTVTTPASVPGPTAFTAAAGAGTATLSWTAPSGLDVVLRSAAGAVPPATATAGTAVTVPFGAHSVSVSGLARGQDYSYSLFTQLTYPDATHMSAPRSLVLRGTTLAATGTATRVSGSATTIGGTLRQATGAGALAGRVVRLYSRPHGSTAAWVLAASGTSSSTGQVAFTVRPARSTDYKLVFAGAGLHLGTESSVVVVSVMPSITVTASRTSAPAGTAVTLTTVVSPNCSGQRVYLQRYYSGAWHNVTSLPLGSTSRAAFVVKPARGTNLYRVTKAASTGLLAATSAVVKVTGT